MLSHIQITNFALIESLELTFESGLNVLSGETGAGKSIIIGALNLILGGRASSDVIRDGADQAQVQAFFHLNKDGLQGLPFSEFGLSPTTDVIIRRVLNREGANRVYLNGTLITLAQLALFSEELISISGQHEHQNLLDPDHQLMLLDRYGGTVSEREKMEEAHYYLQKKSNALEAERKKLVLAGEKTDLFKFQLKEIEAASLIANEDHDLEEERDLIRNAEKIFTSVSSAYEKLYGDRTNVIGEIDGIRAGISEAAELDKRLGPISKQIDDAYYQLNEAAEDLRGHRENLVFEPARLEEIEERLLEIFRLKKKYGQELNEIFDYADNLKKELQSLSNLESKLALLEDENNSAALACLKIASELSRKRQVQAKKMSINVVQELRDLGMPHVKFSVSFIESENKTIGATGLDQIEFLISPNLGEEVKSLARTASGGELSRSLLGLKAILANSEQVQTLVFDEVDAGIGGGIAEVVGRKLKNLADFHQVICITHLPQIAAFGGNHHLVFKEIRGKRTVTKIRPLNKGEKLQEISRMLGGLTPSDKTREAAREMIDRSS